MLGRWSPAQGPLKASGLGSSLFLSQTWPAYPTVSWVPKGDAQESPLSGMGDGPAPRGLPLSGW